MNVYAACFLIPLVVAVYVIVGGLRSTFLCDYTHTVILFIAIFVFGFLMYATSDVVGSPSKFYALLIEASEKMPIARNVEGSYLTFRSVDGLIFAIDLLVAGFCTVWLDQAYWQRAIASRPETSVRAYLLGGIAWYGIPFGFATAMGLGCAALTNTPSFPTYPNPLSTAQNEAGLSSPATAIALLGKGGAVLMLLLLFMAVTSSTSAELIAVSSLLTFDVYKTYIKPDSPSHRLVQVSHYGIIIYALVLATFCCILNAVGLNLTWLLTVLGVIVGGASAPVGLVLVWPRISTVAVVGSPWISLAFGLIAWFVTTVKRSGSITVETTGDVTNALAGNIASCVGGLLIAVILTFMFPKQHIPVHAHEIERANKIQGIVAPTEKSAMPSSQVGQESGLHDVEKAAEASVGKEGPAERHTEKPKSEPEPEGFVPTGNELVDYLETKQMEPMDPVLAKKSENFALIANTVYFFIALILVPFALFGTGWICKTSCLKRSSRYVEC